MLLVFYNKSQYNVNVFILYLPFCVYIVTIILPAGCNTEKYLQRGIDPRYIFFIIATCKKNGSTIYASLSFWASARGQISVYYPSKS